MSFNLVDLVKNLFTNEVITRASTRLGETEAGISKAISGIIPTVIFGFIKKSSSTGGTTSLFNLAKQEAGKSATTNLSALMGGAQNSVLQSKGANLLNNIFANKTESITNTISSFSGIKGSSATSLINITTPVALGVLGSHLVSNNMGVSDLKSLMENQKENIVRALPTGLNLSSFGVTKISDIGSKFSAAVPSKISDKKTVTISRSNRFWPWIIVILILLLLSYFWRGCGEKKKRNVQTYSCGYFSFSNFRILEQIDLMTYY